MEEESELWVSLQVKVHTQAQECSALQTLIVADQILRAGSLHNDAQLHCRMLLRVERYHHVYRREVAWDMIAHMMAEES